jgi:hypothetical protein
MAKEGKFEKKANNVITISGAVAALVFGFLYLSLLIYHIIITSLM